MGCARSSLNFCRGYYAETRPTTGQGAPKGLCSSLFLFPPAPPPPYTHTYRHTHTHTHTQTRTTVYDQRRYLSLSLPNKDSATADISHPRQLGHNLGLNCVCVCVGVCVCLCT